MQTELGKTFSGLRYGGSSPNKEFEAAVKEAASNNVRFSLGDLDMAVRYTENVIKKRWDHLEEAILQSGYPTSALKYCLAVWNRRGRKKRWIAGEDLILQDGYCTLQYVTQVLKKRWLNR